MTKAGLYHYFPTKQSLFDRIVTDTLNDLVDGARVAVGGAEGVDAALGSFMRAHAAFFETNQDRYRASFFGRTGGETSGFTEEQLAARRTYAGILENLLSESVRRGETEIADPKVLARGILGMLNWMARWYRADGKASATEIAAQYSDIVLKGILRR